ncbi:4Fe-4S single cluster domain-containing protein [Sphaerotilus uruguayifluvii]|uniref:Anaerobic ribonucleoside-triphosphate reductase activating protein n=1 Tax=Sphaerotilus uruguayifluvii TaxID=2735897 RepID=A0ABX2G9G5_9BURK|nr:4Fe-4S single cluster domain-containing protein [Leptothrix sp. C29]NRT58070.1 anaerobic ribonucleoside-triphosphate reductase activating protein [Leptothrix sp. C29]
MNGAWLNLARWVDCTEVEGPGRRAALWVQGCLKRCPGCCNPHFLPLVARQRVPAAEVVGWLALARDTAGIEGVTMLGGEPMLQAAGLAEVGRGAQALGLSVMVFSGHTLEELEALQPTGWRELLSVTDVLVDGPYEADQPDTRRRWIGSRNQRVHYLSARHGPGMETLPAGGRDLEVRVDASGGLHLNGWPVRVRRPRSPSAPDDPQAV